MIRISSGGNISIDFFVLIYFFLLSLLLSIPLTLLACPQPTSCPLLPKGKGSHGKSTNSGRLNWGRTKPLSIKAETGIGHKEWARFLFLLTTKIQTESQDRWWVQNEAPQDSGNELSLVLWLPCLLLPSVSLITIIGARLRH